MVFGETKRGRRRVARSQLLLASTLDAEIATVSPKNTSHQDRRRDRQKTPVTKIDAEIATVSPKTPVT
jgi:hypothetical protein